MPVITCQEPGCTNQIRYADDAIEVPLYCQKHRTESGRHSAVRDLAERRKTEPVVVTKKVTLRCQNSSCREKITIPRDEWWVPGQVVARDILCTKCGGKMLFHGDVK